MGTIPGGEHLKVSLYSGVHRGREGSDPGQIGRLTWMTSHTLWKEYCFSRPTPTCIPVYYHTAQSSERVGAGQRCKLTDMSIYFSYLFFSDQKLYLELEAIGSSCVDVLAMNSSTV